LTSCSTSHTTAEWGILGHLLAFLSQQTIFMTLGEITEADKLMNPHHFGSNLADIQFQSWIQILD